MIYLDETRFVSLATARAIARAGQLHQAHSLMCLPSYAGNLPYAERGSGSLARWFPSPGLERLVELRTIQPAADGFRALCPTGISTRALREAGLISDAQANGEGQCAPSMLALEQADGTLALLAAHQHHAPSASHIIYDRLFVWVPLVCWTRSANGLGASALTLPSAHSLGQHLPGDLYRACSSRSLRMLSFAVPHVRFRLR